VQPLFVTLDPARDTPALLTDYVRNFDSRIVPLTGTPSQIAEAAKAFRIAYDIRRGDSRGGDYFVDHSSVLTLIGRDGRYVTTLAANLPGAAIATQLRSLLGSAAKEDLT
jgi:protein SCO1/2